MINVQTLLVFLFFSFLSLRTLYAQEKPNILFVLTDDQRWDSLGCYGNTVIRTPNLDRLAAEGAQLDAFFLAAPLCCPSRAVFLSGLYPSQTGLITNIYDLDLPEHVRTVADYLNSSGYLTGFVGKVHLGRNPKRWGFKQMPVFLPSAISVHENPTLVVNNRMRKVPGHTTTILADAAIDFIERNKNKRWFLWLATTLPHGPRFQDPAFPYKISPSMFPPGWPNTQDFGTDQDALTEWNQYYSMISRLDFEIGRVLQKLDELGLNKNTLVFFTSDNGLMMSSHGEQGKATWFEESIRVPALIRWPTKIQPGMRVPFLLSSVDFFPTLLEIAGSKTPSKREGKSMLPALLNHQPVRQAVFAEVQGYTKGVWKMVRTEHWKYTRESDDTEHLYDLHNDPHELVDLATVPVALHRKLALRRLMESSIVATSIKPFDWLTPLRFVLWWGHLFAVILWIGALYQLYFIYGKAGSPLRQPGLHWNEFLVSFASQVTAAGIAVALTGFALLYLHYLFPSSVRFLGYEGITRRGIWVLIGTGLSICTFFLTLVTFRALKRTLGDQSSTPLVLKKRMSFLASLNFSLVFAVTICFMFASKNQRTTTRVLWTTGILVGMTIVAALLYQHILHRRSR